MGHVMTRDAAACGDLHGFSGVGVLDHRQDLLVVAGEPVGVRMRMALGLGLGQWETLLPIRLRGEAEFESGEVAGVAAVEWPFVPP
ncbi:hypothetical protein AB0N09_34435, partial [Streptomyces erythrochromogenes]|uniref:hypothetical protein n=1 Tax=Streptomyces erythrochromogenes TaxID=285574 RepID=UPI00341BEDDD